VQMRVLAALNVDADESVTVDCTNVSPSTIIGRGLVGPTELVPGLVSLQSACEGVSTVSSFGGLIKGQVNRDLVPPSLRPECVSKLRAFVIRPGHVYAGEFVGRPVFEGQFTGEAVKCTISTTRCPAQRPASSRPAS